MFAFWKRPRLAAPARPSESPAEQSASVLEGEVLPPARTVTQEQMADSMARLLGSMDTGSAIMGLVVAALLDSMAKDRRRQQERLRRGW